MLKLSRISFVALLLLILITSCKEKEYRRSIQVELPNQENNILNISQPGVGTWFWLAQEFEPEGYKPFIDMYAKHTAGSRSETDRNRPNIIVVMADDMGFSDLGCYGSEINTPTIDRLAYEGIRFSQFYNCNVCGPSRAALMTGCYPWKIGQAPGDGIFDNLKRNCVTVMQLLKANGYKTCAVGRLDMVTSDDWHDPAQIARCTDRFLGSASGGPGNYFKEAKGTPWFKDGKRWSRPPGPYSTDLISDFVDDFIESTAGDSQPFFIYFSHYAPHWPLQAKEEDIAPYKELYSKQETHNNRMQARKKRMQARLNYLIAEGRAGSSGNQIGHRDGE